MGQVVKTMFSRVSMLISQQNLLSEKQRKLEALEELHGRQFHGKRQQLRLEGKALEEKINSNISKLKKLVIGHTIVDVIYTINEKEYSAKLVDMDESEVIDYFKFLSYMTKESIDISDIKITPTYLFKVSG